MKLDEAISARRSCRQFAPFNIAEAKVRQLLWAGQGVTDGAGNRTAPSAHGLQPLAIRLVANRITGIANGVYEIAGDLSWRGVAAEDVRARLAAAAYDDQPWISQAAACVCLYSDMQIPAKAFADQAPYGMRGYKYVHIEAGAMAQNIALQAAACGLGAVLVAGFRDESVSAALALPPSVSPLILMCIGAPE